MAQADCFSRHVVAFACDENQRGLELPTSSTVQVSVMPTSVPSVSELQTPPSDVPSFSVEPMEISPPSMGQLCPVIVFLVLILVLCFCIGYYPDEPRASSQTSENPPESDYDPWDWY